MSKRIVKKYPLVANDLLVLVNELEKNPYLGTPVGVHFHKIRMAISGKKTGKNGGARVITYLVEPDEATQTIELHLIAIYDKSEISNITHQELLELLKYD
jgi:hypothetical protein